ncbi:soluble pyridine nucleotide transhydrogenase [Nannochloropsis gaditana]|uniref:NAD(P)(+) transhydrogenase (Si-specific) n=1 Tax=Nannochloropsis gaditana TaxID=72520 RepID=W7T7X5_9STRA|nr:soluble pyridine nucleotide transhydrogenase [Nannochloropsis gaditana]
MWGDFEAIPEHSMAAEQGEEVKSVLQQGGFLGRDTERLFPYGIYTIPEISMIGKTEEQLTAEKVPYEVGIANYKELAKGQMLGGMDGFLKLIFSTEDFRILGVHAIGEGATEIVHIGQVVMAAGGSVHYFVDAVFNFPTLAEAYNVAAHNGLKNMGINV